VYRFPDPSVDISNLHWWSQALIDDSHLHDIINSNQSSNKGSVALKRSYFCDKASTRDRSSSTPLRKVRPPGTIWKTISYALRVTCFITPSHPRSRYLASSLWDLQWSAWTPDLHQSPQTGQLTKICKSLKLTVMFSGITICASSSMPIRPYPQLVLTKWNTHLLFVSILYF
jgi:hypothetical protein